MFSPTVDIIVFLSTMFVLGLALGFLLWKLGSAQEIGAIASEKEFWKKSLDQARLEVGFGQDKIDTLERELAKLKKATRTAKSA